MRGSQDDALLLLALLPYACISFRVYVVTSRLCPFFDSRPAPPPPSPFLIAAIRSCSDSTRLPDGPRSSGAALTVSSRQFHRPFQHSQDSSSTTSSCGREPGAVFPGRSLVPQHNSTGHPMCLANPNVSFALFLNPGCITPYEPDLCLFPPLVRQADDRLSPAWNHADEYLGT